MKNIEEGGATGIANPAMSYSQGSYVNSSGDQKIFFPGICYQISCK